MLSSIPAGSDCRLGPPTVWRPRFFKFTGTPVCLLFSCFLVHLTNDSPGLSPPNEHQLQSGPPPAPQPVGAIVVCLPSSLFLLHFAYFCRRRKAPALAPGLPPALPWVGAIIVVCLPSLLLLLPFTYFCRRRKAPGHPQFYRGPPPALLWVGAIIVVCLPSLLLLLPFTYFCRRRKAPGHPQFYRGPPPALPWVGAIIVVCLPSLLLLLPFTYFCRRRKAPALERGPPLALPWVGAIINKTLHFVCCAMACFAICGTFAWMKEKFKEARVLGWLKGWFGVRRGQ
jgi:hypothetical protein